MKKIFALLLVSVLALGLIGCSNPDTAEFSGSETLMISVEDSVSEEAIEDATIKVNGIEKGEKIDVQPGDYEVTIEKDNYVNKTKNVTVKEGDTNTVKFELDKYATIEFNPVNSKNEDIALAHSINDEGKVEFETGANIDVVDTTNTDDDDYEGEKIEYNDETGNFVIKVAPTDGDGNDIPYDLTFKKYLYNSKEMSGETFSPAEEKTLDIDLSEAKTAEVSVTVEDADGNSVTDKKIYANGVDLNTKTDSNGQATVTVPAEEEVKLSADDVILTKTTNLSYGDTSSITIKKLSWTKVADVTGDKVDEEKAIKFDNFKYASDGTNFYVQVNSSDAGEDGNVFLVLDNENSTSTYGSDKEIGWDVSIDAPDTFDPDFMTWSWRDGTTLQGLNSKSIDSSGSKSDATGVELVQNDDGTQYIFTIPYSEIGTGAESADAIQGYVLHGKGQSTDIWGMMPFDSDDGDDKSGTKITTINTVADFGKLK